jgi:hypothetical protein
MKHLKEKLSPVTRVPLDAIVTDGRFQSRRPDALYGSQRAKARQLSLKHIVELANELLKLTETVDNPARHAHLKPLIVWQPKGSSVYHIISGFHRSAAYRYFNTKLAPSKRQKKKTIPVQIFSGTQEEAFLLSAHQDIQPNIPKTPEQRANAAWELIRTENKAAQALTAQELALNTGVGKRTTERMRQTYKSLQENNAIIHPNWKIQCFAMRANSTPKTEDELWQNKLASMKKQIFSVYLRNGLKGNTEMFTQLLRMITKDLGQLTDKLDDELQDELQELLRDAADGVDEEGEPEGVDLMEAIELSQLIATKAVYETYLDEAHSLDVARLAAILSLSQSQQKSVVIETILDWIDLND